jgi:hypothetical protein
MAFKRAAKAAKIEDFRFHDLRYTAASRLRMQGADIHTVAQLLGHKDLRMAARCQHLSPVFLSDAVEKLDQVFGDRTPIAASRTITSFRWQRTAARDVVPSGLKTNVRGSE